LFLLTFVLEVVMKKFYAGVVCFVCAMMLVACGSTPTANGGNSNAMYQDPEAIEYNNMPEWVRDEGSADGKDFCTVGFVGGTKNLTLKKEEAQQVARVAMAQVLYAEIQSIVDRYMDNTQAGSGSSDEGKMTSVSRQMAEGAVVGARQRKSIMGQYSGKFYVLMCIDAESLKSTFQGMQGLDEAVKEAVSQRAADAIKNMQQAFKDKHKGQ